MHQHFNDSTLVLVHALYWDFMARHQTKLEANPGSPYVFCTWNTFGPKKQEALHSGPHKPSEDGGWHSINHPWWYRL
jgi:deoxyribodipyrimidine photolyase-like uncharacterized protein